MNNAIIDTIGMAVGAAVWLFFELRGVLAKKGQGMTTSQLVWTAQKHVWFLRVLVVVFCASLIGHFEFHTSLLP